MTSKEINITPGKVIALWRIILATSQYQGAKTQDLYHAGTNNSVMGGGLPLKPAIQLAIYYNFIIPKDKRLYLSSFVEKELLPFCQEDEPSNIVLRKIYFEILKDKAIPWIIYFNLEPEIFKVSIPNNWIDLLEMADLLNLRDKVVQDWWHSLIKIKSEINNEKLSTIGHIGEKLTIKFETNRLSSDLIPDAIKKVIWVSKISDDYGFDILSNSGKLLKRTSEIESLLIEVKSSEISNPQIFSFYLSENEWNKALEDMDSYFFFCWPGIRTIERCSIFEKPFIVPSRSLLNLIPKNISTNSQWVKCRVSIDLEELSLKF